MFKSTSSKTFESTWSTWSTFQIPVEIFSDDLTGVQDGFTYVTGGEPNPGDDLRPYNISSPEMFKFILQAQSSAMLDEFHMNST